MNCTCHSISWWSLSNRYFALVLCLISHLLPGGTVVTQEEPHLAMVNESPLSFLFCATMIKMSTLAARGLEEFFSAVLERLLQLVLCWHKFGW